MGDREEGSAGDRCLGEWEACVGGSTPRAILLSRAARSSLLCALPGECTTDLGFALDMWISLSLMEEWGLYAII